MRKIINIKLWTYIGVLLLNIKNLNAQQTGPNTPDFYGFEPVDATDMVDVSTGDLTYTVPLMNVPGPGGGYPIVLSYSAGVGVGQEATWVGMGWRLTPGGIHRSVSGAPDDVNMRNWNFYNSSGTMNFKSAGVNYSFKGISAGISASWGDYTSFGVNAGTGPLSVNMKSNGNIGLSVSPLESFSPSKDRGLNPVMSYSLGVNYNVKSKKTSVYTGFGKSGVGVSIVGSSEGVSYNASLMGNALMANKNVSSNESYSTHTSSDGFTIPLPTPKGYFSLNFSKTKVNWSSRELAYTKQVGIFNSFDDADNIYSSNHSNPSRSMDVLAFTPEEVHFQNTWKGKRTPSILLPAYDNYGVVAQGMSFSMKNNLMETGMLSTYGSFNDAGAEEYYTLSADNLISTTNKQFQVTGTNSGSWQIHPGFLDKTISANDIWTNGEAITGVSHDFHYEIEPTVSYRENNGTPHLGENSDFIPYKEFGKKRIKYYTNQEIIDGNAIGFIEANCLNVVKRENLPLNTRTGIGGYSVTNEQGVTYHYSLPVYQQETLSGKFADSDNKKLTNYSKDYYASSWLLTAITGPDYVDVSGPGELNIGDYGYWVRFDYGLFNDGYAWGTYSPFQKQYSDKTNEWKSISLGLKEIYYLDQVQTNSHTALFFKGERKDGLFEGTKDEDPLDNINNSLLTVFGGNLNEYNNSSCFISGELRYQKSYSKLMSLDKIVLFENSNLPQISQKVHDGNVSSDYFSSELPPYVKYGSWCGGYNNTLVHPEYEDFTRETRAINPYQMNNILDFKEYSAYQTDIESRALQIIDLNYNYDIQNGGLNSDASGFGKLTLESIREYGRNAILTTPPTKFEYYLGNNLDMSGLDRDSYYQLKEDVTDEWGYYNPNYDQLEAHSWSLKSIELPIGSKINITYEEDEYVNEYALDNHLRHMVTDIEETLDPYVYELIFPSRFGNEFILNEEVDLSYSVEKSNSNHADWDITCKIEEIDTKHNKLKVRILNAYFITQNTNWQNIPNLFNGDIIPSLRFDKEIVKYKLELSKQNLIGNEKVKGGGLRVSKIDVTDFVNTYSTIYSYNNLESQLVSGYTSFAPKKYFRPYYIPYNAFIPNPEVKYEYVTEKKTSLNNDWESKTTYKFKVPKFCENCDGSEYRIKGEGNEHFFEVKDYFNQNNIVSGGSSQNFDGDFYYYPTNGISNHFSAFSARESKVTNRLNKIGELESVKRYNRLGQCIYEKKNVYTDNLRSVKEEGYYNRKVIRKYIGSEHQRSYLSTLATYKEIPRKLSMVKTSSSGASNTLWYKDYDMLLGTARTVITENSFGDRNRTKTVYAHEVYPEMGQRTDNYPNRKNMLTQEAASYLYIDNENANYFDDPVINALVTTWNKNWKYREFDAGKYQTVNHYPESSTLHKDIWRKRTTYSWRSKLNPETGAYLKTDGVNLFGTDDEFDFTNEQAYENNALGWVKNSEVMFYDHYSNPKEIKDVNGQFAASKTWKGLTVSSIIGASYSGYCSTGAEELIKGMGYSVFDNPRYFETETKLGNEAELVQTQFHTGKHSVAIQNANREAFISTFYLKPNVNEGDLFDPTDYYVLSVWVKGDIGPKAIHVKAKVKLPNSNSYVSINNPEIIQAGEWYQLRYTFQPISSYTPSNTTLEVSVGSSEYSGILHFDDYRLYPAGAFITTYVYDNQNRLEFILDGNNLGTQYKYDSRGRLKEIYSEKVGADGGFVQTAETKYHMIRDNE